MKSSALFGISVLLISAGIAPARSYGRTHDYGSGQSSTIQTHSSPGQTSDRRINGQRMTGQRINDQQTKSASAGGDGADFDNGRPRTEAETYELRGDILMARKEFSDAKVLYTKVLDLQPKNALVLNKMGIACQQLGDNEGAERYYKKSIRANKTFSNAVNNLGTLEYARKRYGKAISYYRKAVQLAPAQATLYSNLGYAYYSNKQYPEAMASFGKAMALDPTVFDVKNGAGTMIQQRGADNPGMFYFLMAKSYAKAGNAERTAHYLKIARDDGYKDYRSAQKDPAFAPVIKDERVQEVLQLEPSYAAQPDKSSTAAPAEKTTSN